MEIEVPNRAPNVTPNETPLGPSAVPSLAPSQETDVAAHENSEVTQRDVSKGTKLLS